ncbi:MAG: hypothetical protein R3F50_11035 [Gammaproteobacteria bacterium]
MTESAALFGARRALAGVLTQGDSSAEFAVILLNAGMIHSAGPGRLSVKLARELTKNLGITSVRFDLSGLGDSPVRADSLSIFEIATTEPQEIMDDLQRRGFKQFILIGLCSGAYCAFKTAIKDARVVAAVLINTMDLSGETEPSIKTLENRYQKSIFRWRAWGNLFTGKVNYAQLWRMIAARFQRRSKESSVSSSKVRLEIEELIQKKTPLFFVCSEYDVSRYYLSGLLGDKLDAFAENGWVTQTIIKDADHLFNRVSAQRVLLQTVCEWVGTRTRSTLREKGTKHVLD